MMKYYYWRKWQWQMMTRNGVMKMASESQSNDINDNEM